ncbi:hypothetical protein HPP92_013919 [Vanilla planifolia]|uniref:Uncharacterized protein n=1 Tax=Vanilla planifolia TaxID=51239 RepID=A0A835V0F6_VANPL|nr:hypothetical protein HPP92_013919 [Vanilla planifolia]
MENSASKGATIRVVSGPFSRSTGYLKDRIHTLMKKATVGITLFGKESSWIWKLIKSLLRLRL